MGHIDVVVFVTGGAQPAATAAQLDPGGQCSLGQHIQPAGLEQDAEHIDRDIGQGCADVCHLQGACMQQRSVSLHLCLSFVQFFGVLRNCRLC